MPTQGLNPMIGQSLEFTMGVAHHPASGGIMMMSTARRQEFEPMLQPRAIAGVGSALPYGVLVDWSTWFQVDPQRAFHLAAACGNWHIVLRMVREWTVANPDHTRSLRCDANRPVAVRAYKSVMEHSPRNAGGNGRQAFIGVSVFALACYEGALEVVRALLDEELGVDVLSYCPLIHACAGLRLEVVRLLLADDRFMVTPDEVFCSFLETLQDPSEYVYQDEDENNIQQEEDAAMDGQDQEEAADDVEETNQEIDNKDAKVKKNQNMKKDKAQDGQMAEEESAS